MGKPHFFERCSLIFMRKKGVFRTFSVIVMIRDSIIVGLRRPISVIVMILKNTVCLNRIIIFSRA